MRDNGTESRKKGWQVRKNGRGNDSLSTSRQVAAVVCVSSNCGLDDWQGKRDGEMEYNGTEDKERKGMQES